MRQLPQQAKRLLPARTHYTLERSFDKLRAAAYSGDQVYCPWCHASFRSFVEYRVSDQTTGLRGCPRCHTFARHRLLWFYLKQHPALLAEAPRLLHVAPEAQVVDEIRRQYQPRSYITVDAASPIADLRSDIRRLALADHSVDLILDNDAFEHIADEQQATAEFYRVLGSGGCALLVMRFPVPTETADIVARLKNAGFEVDMANPALTMSQGMLERYGLSRDECVLLCRRTDA